VVRSEELIGRATGLVARGEALIQTRHPPPRGVIGSDRVAQDQFYEWHAASQSFLQMVFGEKHPHTRTFAEKVNTYHYSDTLQGLGILRAALEELKQGFVGRLQQLLAAEIFTNFLDMAVHLLEAGYKDAAASLGGAVLEDGLRRIAAARSVTVKGRDDLGSLNQRLADAEVYNRLTQRRVHAWNELRNSADHGKFSEYKADEVQEMLQGVARFLDEHL
jgi:hypothetical protein